MQYELIAVLCILLCLLLLGLEYLWLALLAKKQEDNKNKYDTIKRKCTSIIEGIIYSPSESCREAETQALYDLMKDDTYTFEIINDQLCSWDEYGDDDFEDREDIIDGVYAKLDPIKLFSDIIKSKDKYNTGYACRRLADFDAYDYLNDIYELSKSKNRNISYNAAMALSRLGYTEGVAEYILKIESDKKYSFRIVNELFDNFSFERFELAELVLKDCDEHMKTVVIKAIAPYGFSEFEQIYIDGTVSKDTAMRVSCVKALGELANPNNEHILLVAAKDKDWVVRSSAVKGLQKIATPDAIDGIKEAIKDKEWWVRQAAATALIEMDVNISDIEEVLSGYDKYASDAAKYALYRYVNLNSQ